MLDEYPCKIVFLLKFKAILFLFYQTLQLVHEIKSLKANLQDTEVGKSTSALAIIKLIPSGRLSAAETWHRVIHSKTGQEMKSQLLDLLAAVQTFEAFKAARESLKFESEDDFNYAERYLQGLAIGTRPEPRVVEGKFFFGLFQLFKNTVFIFQNY